MLTPLPLVSICTDVGGGTRDCGDPSPSEHQETQGIISRVRFASVTSWVLTSIPQGWLAADLDLSFCLIAMFSFFISFSDMKGDILLNEKGSVVFGSFRVADVLTRGEMVSITFADDLVFVPQFSIFLPLFVPPPIPHNSITSSRLIHFSICWAQAGRLNYAQAEEPGRRQVR